MIDFQPLEMPLVKEPVGSVGLVVKLTVLKLVALPDKVTVIKLNEIVNIISELSKESSINNEDIVNLLQYYQLIDEIRTVSK